MAMQRTLEVFCGSWNMGNAMAEGLEEFIPSKGGNFDLLAIGLQESQYKVDASDKVADVDHAASSKDATTHTFQENMEKAFDPSIAHLTGKICAILGSDFYMVDHANRYQMQLMIFARIKLQRSIQHIEKTGENTGILGILPNKGGLCICFTIDATKLAFISSHLAAHEGAKKCSLRNDHVKGILGGVRAGDKRFDVTVQFHHVFFMGDMNYRLALPSTNPDAVTNGDTSSHSHSSHSVKKTIPSVLSTSTSTKVAPSSGVRDDDEEEDEEEETSSSSGGKDDERTIFEDQIYRTLSERRWNDLWQHDELCREINAGRVLPGFSCALPRFPPTFKRIRQRCMPAIADITKQLSVSELKGYYDGKRLPAYTDRILYRSLPGFAENLQLLSFECCEEVTSSDHKPVKTSFELQTTVGAELDILTDSAGSKSKLELDISNLKGHDLAEMDVKVMGMGGGSDPYIVIHTDPPSVLIGDQNTPGVVKSRTIMHDLNPDWGKDVLHLNLNTHDVGGLSRNAHLMISVWDYDRFNEDDLIGVCSLPLKTLLGQLAVDYKKSSRQGYSFREPLHSNGSINGYLSGTITLSSAIASKSDMQSQLIEHASRYTDALADDNDNNNDDHGNGTWNDATGVPTTSQQRPHPSLVNPSRSSPQSTSMMSLLPVVTDSHMSAMRVEASLRATTPTSPTDDNNSNSSTEPKVPLASPPSSSSSGPGPGTSFGLPAVPPPPISTPPPTNTTNTTAFPTPTPPTPPRPPTADDNDGGGTIDIGPRKLSLKIGDKELVAREKKDLGERPELDHVQSSTRARANSTKGGSSGATSNAPLPAFPHPSVPSGAPTIASAPGQGLAPHQRQGPGAAGIPAAPGTRASKTAPVPPANGNGGCCVVA